jgi:hypothetical protein
MNVMRHVTALLLKIVLVILKSFFVCHGIENKISFDFRLWALKTLHGSCRS